MDSANDPHRKSWIVRMIRTWAVELGTLLDLCTGSTLLLTGLTRSRAARMALRKATNREKHSQKGIDPEVTDFSCVPWPRISSARRHRKVFCRPSLLQPQLNFARAHSDSLHRRDDNHLLADKSIPLCHGNLLGEECQRDGPVRQMGITGISRASVRRESNLS